MGGSEAARNASGEKEVASTRAVILGGEANYSKQKKSGGRGKHRNGERGERERGGQHERNRSSLSLPLEKGSGRHRPVRGQNLKKVGRSAWKKKRGVIKMAVQVRPVEDRERKTKSFKNGKKLKRMGVGSL